MNIITTWIEKLWEELRTVNYTLKYTLILEDPWQTMVTAKKWIKRAILWCFRFSLALGCQCVIFGIIYGNLFVLRFLWYSSADQGTCYPASRGYIFAVWAGVRKCQLIPRKCSLCSQGRNMQILHAEFDKKKFFSHLFSRKNYFNTIRIEITSERQNDKLQTKETD